MIRVGVIGLGKMGLSHLAILGAHAGVEVAGVCDASGYILSVLGKYSGFPTYSAAQEMFREADLDAVLIATPTESHGLLARQAIESGLHVFVEKPFGLDAAESTELAELAASRGVVGQVGYHNRFVAAFQETKRIIDSGALGRITHVLAESYGPVVLKTKGGTWRSQKDQGGGALYDYAAHPLNLLNWYFGELLEARGVVLGNVFSQQTDDEVYAGLLFPRGVTGQLSVNWSDESQRKMTTKVSIWGTMGRLFADRQECQVYLRSGAKLPEGYNEGWNVRYTTDLTVPVDFYLRGEEYSAQLDAWVTRIAAGSVEGTSDLHTGAATDRAIALLIDDATDYRPPRGLRAAEPKIARARGRRRLWSRTQKAPLVARVGGAG